MNGRSRGLVLALVMLAPAMLRAQGELPKDSGPDTNMRAILERETEPQPGQYAYNPGGRRDPFVSLIKPVEGTAQPKRKEGMEGFLVNEVALKGIVKTKDGYVALIVGPDGKAYFPKVGQRLFDGAIIAMDQTTVTFRQEDTNPLSPVRVREIKKSLYPEEARQ
jgi:hypothetical protein